MSIASKAARVVWLDARIELLQSRDPDFVERRLVPRRARAWNSFKKEWSPDCSSSDVHDFFMNITKGAQP
jgi:hypothetical protein